MPIISIDDRDVNNYYSSSVISNNKINEWKLQLQSMNTEFRIVYLGSKIYKIELPTIECDGAYIVSRIKIPFNHLLQKMELKHTDINKNDSGDSLQYSMYKRTIQNIYLLLYDEDNVLHSDIVDEYTGYYHELCQYNLVTKTTNNDKLFISLYVQLIGD